MPAINRVPRGLLSVLDGQVMGDNPKDLSPFVQSQLDILPMYLASRGWEAATATGVQLPGTGLFTNGLVVPAGEFWFVRSFSISCSYGAGLAAFADQILTPMWAAQAAGTFVGLGAPVQLAVINGSQTIWAVDFPGFITVSAGNVMGWSQANELLDTTTYTVAGRIARFAA